MYFDIFGAIDVIQISVSGSPYIFTVSGGFFQNGIHLVHHHIAFGAEFLTFRAEAEEGGIIGAEIDAVAFSYLPGFVNTVDNFLIGHTQLHPVAWAFRSADTGTVHGKILGIFFTVSLPPPGESVSVMDPLTGAESLAFAPYPYILHPFRVFFFCHLKLFGQIQFLYAVHTHSPFPQAPEFHAASPGISGNRKSKDILFCINDPFFTGFNVTDLQYIVEEIIYGIKRSATGMGKRAENICFSLSVQNQMIFPI